MDDSKANKVENRLTSLEVSTKWHNRLLIALYAFLGLLLLSLLSKLTITGFSVINTQEVSTMDWSIFQPLLVVLAALIRSMLGWAKASFRDGTLDEFELRLLGETIVRVGLIGAVVAYIPGLSITWIETSAIALGGDILLQAWKGRKAPVA